MDLMGLTFASLPSGLFASGLAILLTAPARHVAGTFLCAVAGRLARDVLMNRGISQNWATVLAAAVIVLVAVALTRRRVVSPVVLIAAAVPLGAAVAVFNAIAGIIKVSSLEGEALNAASVALSANLGRAFTGSLAIALGLALGLAIARLARRKGVWEEV